MADSEKRPSEISDGCSYCCCCLHVCCRQEHKKRVAGVEYELVPSNSEGMIFNNIPTPDIVKGFTMPQAQSEYAVPLSLSPKKGKRSIRRPITAQPKRQRSASEPSMPPDFHPDVTDFSQRTLPTIDSTQSLPIYSPTLTTGSHFKQMSMPEELTGWKPSLSSIDDVEEPTDEADVRSGKPELEFSLYYDIQCRTLMVHLQCARNLPIKGKKVSLDPTVLLYLLPNREDIFQSRVIRNNANPRFNQSFEFRGLLPDEIRRQTLVFRVFSQSSKGELLGGLSLSLSEADLFGVMSRKRLDTDIEKLKMVTRGDLLISLKHNPATKKLEGFLLKATNLQKQDIVGLADPYVKIWLLKNGRRYQKWKSKVKRNTLIPIFNEPFQFDLSEVHPKQVALEILMMDYDRFSRNDVVGVVYIGTQVPHDTGQQHWEQVISQPNASISSWHAILPITAETERTTRKKKVSRAVTSSYDSDED